MKEITTTTKYNVGNFEFNDFDKAKKFTTLIDENLTEEQENEILFGFN